MSDPKETYQSWRRRVNQFSFERKEQPGALVLRLGPKQTSTWSSKMPPAHPWQTKASPVCDSTRTRDQSRQHSHPRERSCTRRVRRAVG